MYQRLYRYLFYIILFLLTYLFYIFPFETLNKYLSNETSLIEADLSEEKKEEIQQMALNAFHACGCKSWARVDFLQDNNGNFFVIEINTAPGMTSHSLVPKAGSFLGLSYEEVLKNIINASL